MSKRLNLANLSIGQKMLAALLGLLATVLVVVNLVFVSAAYWIAQQSLDPHALHSIGRLVSNSGLSQQALTSASAADRLLKSLADLAPLRAAALYDGAGQRLAYLQHGESLQLPEQFAQVPDWLQQHANSTHLVALAHSNAATGHLLLVAEQQLSPAFYQGTVSASLLILCLSLLLWLVVARQVRKLVTKPIRRLEELSRQVTNQENYSLRARPGNNDELGSLAEAFNTMLTRIQAREDELKRARDDAQIASDAAQQQTKQTRHANRKLEMEVQVRNKIEKKLTGFQNYLNSIINSMPSALIALDEQQYVTQWNQEASRLSGTPVNKALNQPIFLAFPALKPYLEQLKHTSERQQIATIERVTWLKEAQPQHFALTFYPLLGSHGRGVVIRIDDISQRLAMEELMVQSEKMLSVGGLAAGMAHEINNPLGAILHNVQNIRRRLSDELAKNLTQAADSGIQLAAVNDYLQRREIPQLLDGIQQAGARAAKIVTHMLSFSRLSSRELSACQLPLLINQAVEIAGNDFDLIEGFDFKGLQIQREFDPQLGSVPATANELEQVLLNLLKNAAQAIHQRPAGQPPGRIILRCKLSPPWAEIQVEDNGIGMPESVRKRIFEPFFTTKEIGQGTGLGLSVAYFIITNNHKGQMEVHSKLGQGSCFSVRLPLQQTVAHSGV
jgi:signal transduction histidine kinase/HAMP domain-containing protein